LITDLTTAIEVGVILAALLFMQRMANVVEISSHAKVIDEDVDDFTRTEKIYEGRGDIPDDVEVLRINGPFFFGSAARRSLGQSSHAAQDIRPADGKCPPDRCVRRRGAREVHRRRGAARERYCRTFKPMSSR